jgi:hypothetical protein
MGHRDTPEFVRERQTEALTDTDLSELEPRHLPPEGCNRAITFPLHGFLVEDFVPEWRLPVLPANLDHGLEVLFGFSSTQVCQPSSLPVRSARFRKTSYPVMIDSRR